MTHDMMPRWAPTLDEDLLVGPPRWNGSTMVADLGLAPQHKILQVGLVEQLVLEQINGDRTPSEITEALNNDGLAITEQQVWGVINKLAVNGIISVPFMPSGPNAGEPRAMPASADGVYVPKNFKVLNLWRSCGWLGKLPVIALVLIAGLAGAGLLAWSVPGALEAATNLEFLPFVGFFALALVWDLVVMLMHETAHSGSFYGMSGRPARLAVARFGIIFLPNSQLPGVNLLPRWKKVLIILMGPGMALAFALIPVAVFHFCDPGTAWHSAAAVIILVETVIIGLGLTFLPNSDATRLVETITGVEDLHVTSFKAIGGSQKAPRSLATRSRLAIYGYPGLLLLSLLAWVVAIAWAVRFTLS